MWGALLLGLLTLRQAPWRVVCGIFISHDDAESVDFDGDKYDYCQRCGSRRYRSPFG